MIRTVEARGALDIIRRLKQGVGQVFRFAIAIGWAERDPTVHLNGALRPKPRVRHMARVPLKDIPELVRTIASYDGEDTPRHRHNAYYILAGEARFGSARLGPGAGMFVPADQAYVLEVGDEGCELLEFRNAAQFNIHFKGNDEAHWEKVAQSYTRHMQQWEAEIRPSQR